jgi:hypothetical protein
MINNFEEGNMRNVKEFDRDTCREAMDLAKRIMQDAFKEAGITVKMGRGTFSPERLNLKFELFAGDGKDVIDRKQWDAHCGFFDLKREDLGRKFVHNRDTFTVTGIKPGSPKFPILATNSAGKTFKFKADAVVKGLAS